ncbi:ABC transporter substrate-binding protein [uncultured Bartonella sp.]|uniref:ABC transporter substrate-binding protein n=1 Tax=uncultured Bartonella sp. TaxID=104108 RepID=UPI0025CC55B0|nr:ABC transporter substrate-binding protein [uncultured Bartonella sp.]
MKTIHLKTIILAAAISCFSIAFHSNAFADETHYPLTVKNCGRTLVFNKAPERVVSVGQNTTEILYALGLSDKVKGTALWYSPVLPQFTEVNKNVKMLSHDVPSFESIIAEKPDLVASHQEWVIGPAGSAATYDQFKDFEIPVYTAPADCVGKDNLAGSDGLRTAPFTMDMIYQEISELALIFNVQDRGEKLVKELKGREQAAIDKVKNLPKGKISAVFWYSSADLDIDPYVAGDLGAPGYIMKILGIKNVIESNYEWPTVGWETIVKANPTIIVLAEMDRRRFPADNVVVKRDFLKKDPVTKLLPAVDNDRLVNMDVQSMNTTMRTIDGIEKLANAIVELGLLKE